MAMHQPGRAGQLRAELVVRTARAARGSQRRVHDVRRADRGRQAAGALGTLRRPLQPGPPVPDQPDPDRAGAHRRRVRVRAVQVRTARHPRPHGGQPAQRRRGVRRRDRRRARASTRSRRPSAPARAPITDLPPSPALSIVDNGPANFAGRKFGVLITDGTDARRSRRAAQGGGRRGRAGRADRPRDRRRHAQRRPAPAGAPEASTAARRCSTTPSPSSPPPTAPPLLAADAGRQGLRHRRPRPLPSSSATRRVVARRCSTRPASPRSIDDGYVQLDTKASFTTFVERCRDLRYWPRQLADSPA